MLFGIIAVTANIIDHYTFSAETEIYSAISGTTVPTAIGDNVLSNPIDIGFVFNYGTNSYSQIKISSNGYFTLGTGPGSTANNALSSPVYCPVLAPLWDDNYLQGSAQYLLSGTAPNRIFTVQIAGMKWPTNTPTQFNYQVRLHENSKIEFLYGPGVGNTSNASASIGINMLPGDYENYISITPGSPATFSTTWENSNVNTWPGVNTKYVFNVNIPHANDLAAMSISGNQLPSVGLISTYSIGIKNYGSAAQSTYSVKIVSQNQELASVEGPTIAAGATMNVVVPWTPSIQGARSISAKVVLLTDENSANDQSPALMVNVQPEGSSSLTIGSGSQTARKPIDFTYRNSMFQTIFPASEITLTGNITGIAFYNNFTDNPLNMPTKIWLGNTTTNDLSAGWIPAYQMVQVFNGNVNYLMGENIIYIPFNGTPFQYSGGNLVLMVQRPMDTNVYGSQNVFYAQTRGTNRSRHAGSDGTEYDPNNMDTLGSVSGQFPKSSFVFSLNQSNPEFSVTPPFHNFGEVIIHQSSLQEFQVSNSGGGVLTLSSIELSNNTEFSLQSLPNLPISLSSGESVTFEAKYQPLNAGIHSATISITDDLNRLVHTVVLSGTGIDPSIHTIPYTQNFDSVSSPNLPYAWSKIAFGSATVTTVTTDPYSTPNALRMNNSNSANGPYAVMPPIGAEFELNQLKLTFQAKGAYSFSLSVGLLENPNDYSSFIPVQDIELTVSWAPYLVDFRNFVGTGRYIAFRHNQGGNNRSIYIDNVSLETIPHNDLAVLGLTGASTLFAGTTYNYNVTLYNWGLNAQNDYQVKLYKAGGVELASIDGPALEGNQSETVVIPWTPINAENTHLYAKVILAADENPANDQSQNLNITIQESNTTLVVIGQGDQSSYEVPFHMNYTNSLFQTIYSQSEIDVVGQISIVNLYHHLTSTVNASLKIWMGNTTLTSVADAWISLEQMSLVYDGLTSFPANANDTSIILQRPFTLLEGYNLVILMQYESDTVYNFGNTFYCSALPSPRSRRVYGNTEINPNNPQGGSTTALFPKIGFYITPGGVGNLEGTVFGEFGQSLVNATLTLNNSLSVTTDQFGHYNFLNLFASDYSVTASMHGYNSQLQYVTINEDETSTLDFQLTPVPTATVRGTVRRSDFPEYGLDGAVVRLEGYSNYQMQTDSNGVFEFLQVFVDSDYELTISYPGYQIYVSTFHMDETDMDLGIIILNEVTQVPSNLVASLANDHESVNISWSAASREDRALVGYKVYRFAVADAENESAWEQLTPEAIPQQGFVDTLWNTLPNGWFKWAVKSVYTNGVLSAAVISNSLQTTGKLTGVVRNNQSQVLAGATISTGNYSTTTDDQGVYTLYLPQGIYSISCWMQDYFIYTEHSVQVQANQTTTLDFLITSVANDDDHLNLITALNANYPNPFNPSTSISYSLQKPVNVLLEIYNQKGQKVRTLVNEYMASGKHIVLWDGKDNNGNPVSSGVYRYSLKAGEYKQIRKMTLKK